MSDILEDDSANTLSFCLCPINNRDGREVLEQTRIDYERRHGPTDLTRFYTSMWPDKQRDWLYRNMPEQFFNGLPPFAQEYYVKRLSNTIARGHADDLPDGWSKFIASKTFQNRRSR